MRLILSDFYELPKNAIAQRILSKKHTCINNNIVAIVATTSLRTAQASYINNIEPNVVKHNAIITDIRASILYGPSVHHHNVIVHIIAPIKNILYATHSEGIRVHEIDCIKRHNAKINAMIAILIEIINSVLSTPAMPNHKDSRDFECVFCAIFEAVFGKK